MYSQNTIFIILIEVILTPQYDRVKPRTFIFTDHSSGLLLYLNIYYSDFNRVASCISLALFGHMNAMIPDNVDHPS